MYLSDTLRNAVQSYLVFHLVFELLLKTSLLLLILQAPVVQKVDSAIQWINLYPVDSAIGFPNTYPLDSAIQRLNNLGQVYNIVLS